MHLLNVSHPFFILPSVIVLAMQVNPDLQSSLPGPTNSLLEVNGSTRNVAITLKLLKSPVAAWNSHQVKAIIRNLLEICQGGPRGPVSL